MRTLTTVCLTALFLTPALPGGAETEASPVGIQYQYSREPGQQAVYVGKPEGFTDRGGFIVGDVSIQKPYAISILEKGNRQMWWFEQIVFHQVHRRPQGLANQQTIKVLDAVESPKDVYPVTACQLKGKQDPELFALIQDSSDRNEWITEFHQVLRANRQTQKLEAIAPEGIRCPNPAWGI